MLPIYITGLALYGLVTLYNYEKFKQEYESLRAQHGNLAWGYPLGVAIGCAIWPITTVMQICMLLRMLWKFIYYWVEDHEPHT